MNWKCPACGFDNTDGHSECQGGCGYEAIPLRLTLLATETGKELSISITTSFGKDLLRSFAGEGAIYASNPQFVIFKDFDGGGWYLEHASTAKNPTFVNGTSAVSERTKLQTASYLTIGPEKMRLEVSFP
jgi:hypothetical protein